MKRQKVWAQVHEIIDYILSKTDSIEKETLLQRYWSDPLIEENEYLKLYIARIGVSTSNSVQWKTRLHESLITCMAKQSEHFRIKEHWLNPEVLL